MSAHAQPFPSALPPPTVPAQSSDTLPPPPPTTANKSHLAHNPSAPFPSSASSFLNTLHPRNLNHSSASEDERPSTDIKLKPSVKPKPLHLHFFTGHTVAEAGRSSWLGPISILLFRLAVSAMLVSHLVFFSLSAEFSFSRYSTWAYTALTLAFLLVLVSSLIELLRSDDDDASQHVDEEAPPHLTPPSHPGEPVDRPLLKVLAQVTVPIYQVAVTAQTFGCIVYWAFVHPSQHDPITYPLLSLNVAAPAAALFDMFFSLSIRFRLVYVPLFALYNAAYAAALYAFFKLHDRYVYLFLDPSESTKISFVAKVVGLSFASVILALILCLISATKELPFVKRRADKLHNNKFVDKSDFSEPDGGSSPSEDTSEASRVLKTKQAGSEKEAHFASAGTSEKMSVINEDVAEVVEDTEDEEKLFGSDPVRMLEARDRSSLPISSRTSSLNGVGAKKRTVRISSFTGMARSLSGGSLGEDGAMSRHSMSQFSVWDELDVEGLHPKPGEEYFKMPAAYTGGKEEVVKLTPLPRDDSNKSGILSLSGSAKRLSRTSSNLSGSFMKSLSTSRISGLAAASSLAHTGAARTTASSTQRPHSG